ncbi:hypothetical protein IV203_007646 [Nitzschia inconspicua]|uniref:Sulfotransferase n=1 Tax=Nitzschia inconspicua TaxID=303405 RepID=A0A9K3PCK6_9STRA|nr:hypothetical protein IV203_007646 [Nitzschia inconspicua]
MVAEETKEMWRKLHPPNPVGDPGMSPRMGTSRQKPLQGMYQWTTIDDPKNIETAFLKRNRVHLRQAQGDRKQQQQQQQAMRVGRSDALGVTLIVIVLSVVNYSNILESTVVIGQFQRQQGSLEFGISIPVEQQQQQQQQRGRVELYNHDYNDDHGDLIKREKDFTTNAENGRIRNKIDNNNNRTRHRQTSNGTVVIRRKHRNGNSNSNRSSYTTTSTGGDASTEAKPLVLTDFLSHIPKTGGEYAFKALETILDSIPAYTSQKTFHNVTRLCNQGVAKEVRRFSSHYPTDEQIATGQPRYVNVPRLECQFHMSEADYTTVNTAHKTYTILREPVSHTLSMYYHCKESPAHKSRASYMADALDEWLDTWANVSRYKKEKKKKANNDNNNDDNNTNNKTAFVDARIAILSKDLGRRRRDFVFKCYNPLDFQSRWTELASTAATTTTTTTTRKKDKSNDTVVGIIDDNDDDTDHHHHHKSSDGRNGHYDDWKRRLQDQYVVLGDQSQMDKTVCLMFLEYTQGEYGIPTVCDCTATTTTTTPMKQRRWSSSSSTSSSTSSSFLDLTYDPSKHSHGVLHHGSNVDTLLTKPQRELIRTEIRPRDVVLYRLGREIFSEQVSAMEDRLQVRICDTFRTFS